jgi:glycolate oxidase FAD binding subunit
VMKNVAGYDVSRLVAGSLGTLGVILEVSFKVLPLPARERTVAFSCAQDEAIHRVNRWAGTPLPLSAASWHDNRLLLRLSGTVTQTERAIERIQPEEVLADSGHWEALREHRHPFFDSAERLWRIAVPPATEPLPIEGDGLMDWGGGQRWYVSDEPTESIREKVERAGGHATLFRGGPGEARFHPLPPAMRALQERIRYAMDPAGIFNPGRLYRDG